MIARQAEAERERRAKVINAEGEFQAAGRLRDAARVLSSQPASLQLRFLQTASEIAAEHNSTTLFPLPLDLAPLWGAARAVGGAGTSTEEAAEATEGAMERAIEGDAASRPRIEAGEAEPGVPERALEKAEPSAPEPALEKAELPTEGGAND